MSMHSGYSDRVAHALAFAAKHGAAGVRRGTPGNVAANVAIILARYGCDEVTLVAGVLAALVNGSEASRRQELHQKISSKFDPMAVELLSQLEEPQYDGRKRRGWKAWKMDFQANLALMDPRALDVVSASQILVCGTMLTHVRRLGVEYITLYGPAPPEELLWWCGNLTDALERHPVGPKPGMVTELRDLTSRLAAAIAAS